LRSLLTFLFARLSDANKSDLLAHIHAYLF